ncbi:MAG: flagellar hook capping FlgD N-terminal domain-containing protein [Geminicoccaceae bacterium]|jgi:flagellar basal-body rod modification protein FlgD
MPTTPVSAPSQPVARPRAPEETGLASNFETFLQLLTTQLKNQDPLSPMDTERFTSQLVQFSAVEQALKTNRQLEQLVSLTRTSAASAALGMVGREVRVDGSRMLVDAQGGATIYELPERAASVTVRIFDADGRLIHSAVGGTEAGSNRFFWDGKRLDGSRAATGLYRITVTALDAAGRPIEAVLERTTRIDSLETRESGLVLVADGVPIAAEAVRPLPTSES